MGTIPDGGRTGALIARSLCWDNSAIRNESPLKPRTRFQNEAMAWQKASQMGDWAEIKAQVDQRRRRPKPPEGNRILEIHGLIGGIGEQAGLCWTAEQDAQRLAQTASARGQEHQRLVLRAVAETAGHFLLGAAHSLGNLALRVGLLSPQGQAVAIQKQQKRNKNFGGFSPGSADRDAWLTLYQATAVLGPMALAANNTHFHRIADSIGKLSADAAFKAFDDRRGMDYHRPRPQSVPHNSPRAGVYKVIPGGFEIDIVTATLDSDADEKTVHQLLTECMMSAYSAMRLIRDELPKAIRKEGINYH